jgi:hypothetical protein
MGRPGRMGRSWFSYDIRVEAAHPMAIVATYYSDDRRATPAAFEIQVDGKTVGEQTVERSTPRRFFDVTYAVPADLVRGKDKVTVRFQAKTGSQIATVFGIRMIRADTGP